MKPMNESGFFSVFITKFLWRKFFFVFIICIIQQCSGRFVNQVELKKLKEQYNGNYVMKKPVDIGNNLKARVGEKVKIYFVSTSNSIKVYAYSYQEPRESSLGNNILYLFEDDFPDEKWDHNLLNKKLNDIIRKSR